MKLRSGTMTDSKDIKIGVVGDSSYKLSCMMGDVRLWLSAEYKNKRIEEW